MAVTYTNAVKQDRMDAVTALIDAGTGPGYIEIGTAAMATVLCTITFDATCAGAATGAGVVTFSNFPKSDTSAAAAGTAAAARIRDSAATDIITGLTVNTNPTTCDIALDNLSIAAGQTVTIAASPTLTHA